MSISIINKWGLEVTILPQPQYQIPSGSYHYGFTIEPVKAK
ncbi:MAG: hypothetical protein OCD00_03235 [Colwellia sp.]